MRGKIITVGVVVSLYAVCLVSIASAQVGWWRTYGGTGSDDGRAVQQTSDGGYIIAGCTYSFGAGGGDVYLIKTGASGDTLWTRTYGGPSVDYGNSVQQTSDGGYIIAGWTFSYGAGDNDVYLLKTNAQGDTLWTRTYGGSNIDAGLAVQQTADSGYVLAGVTCSFGVGTPVYPNVYLIKTNAQGDTLWTRTYGGSDDDEGNSVQQTSDGDYVITGYTASFGAGSPDVYLIKTDAQGDILWTGTYGGANSDEGEAVQQTLDSGYVVTGYTASFGAGNSDVYLIKTDANGNVGIDGPLKQHPVRPTSFLVQPNPFTSLARVPGHETELFALSDVTGRQVAVCEGDRVGEGLRPGVYFLSPVSRRAGKTLTATVVKVAFYTRRRK